MSGGSPRTNSAMRLEVESCVTEMDLWLALNFATRLSKYGMTSGFVSSSTMLVHPPADEHPATRPGAASAALPSPTAFIIARRVSGIAPALVTGSGASWRLPDRTSLCPRMPGSLRRERPSIQTNWAQLGEIERSTTSERSVYDLSRGELCWR